MMHVMFYTELIRLLTGRGTIGQVCVLEYVIKNKYFNVPDMRLELTFSEEVVQNTIRTFKSLGIVNMVPKAELPEESVNWTNYRRQSYKKKMNISRRNHYRFDYDGFIKALNLDSRKSNEIKNTIDKIVRDEEKT